jgi:hypothetical protein
MSGGGSFLVPLAHSPSAKTDADGVARIVFDATAGDSWAVKLQAAEERGIRAIALRVDHPDHPVWMEYVGIEGDRRVILSDSTTIEVRAHRDKETRPLNRLFPVLSGSLTSGADWAERDGVLTVRRVDLESEKASRWLRIVHVPDQGPILFSDMIDLKLRTENPISLQVPLKPGVRAEGRLDPQVPRPIKNGRVVARIATGTDTSTNWRWSVIAEISPDGRFVLDAFPADENLQLIALCDGWVSAATTAAEAAAYAAENSAALDNRGHVGAFVHPRLYRLKAPVIQPIVPMLRTANCEVTVVNENGRPIPDASVAFWPCQLFYNLGSNIIGSGVDALTLVRAQLASGKHRTSPDFSDSSLAKAYTAKTDARGIAIVRNLPLGGAAESTTPTTLLFDVSHDGYAPIAGPLDSPTTRAQLLPGQTGHVTVRLKRQ